MLAGLCLAASVISLDTTIVNAALPTLVLGPVRRQDMRRWAATAAMVLGVLGASMAPAHADPVNAPNVQPFPITCDGTTATVVVVPGQGGWTPALVTTSTAVLVPFSVELTITSLATGERVTFSVSKQAATQTATTTCRFQQTFTNPQTGQTHQVVGVLEVLRQPSASSR